MNPYPVLDRLYDELVVHLCPMKGRSREDDIFVVVPLGNSVNLTPAEVLALADELKAFVAAQTPPQEPQP